jgi:hypothetical protein
LSGGATIDVAYEIRLRGEDAEAMADAVAGNIEEVASNPELLASSVNSGIADSFALSEDEMENMSVEVELEEVAVQKNMVVSIPEW